MDNKLATITQLFDGKEIRSIWDAEKEDYYFSVVDVILVLTDSPNPRDYWYRLKTRMTEEEKSEVSTKCRQLKMKAQDGKFRSTDALDTKGIFRLIESIPSPKAEPFKMWLAKLGSDKIDEAFDPSKGIDQMIDFYLKKGYTLEWIEARIKAIFDRKKLTNVWHDGGIKKYDYKNPIDVVYTLIWLEELIPNYSVNLECTKNLSSDDILKIQTAIDKWNIMKSKRNKREISYKEYTNWKLTYDFGGDSND